MADEQKEKCCCGCEDGNSASNEHVCNCEHDAENKCSCNKDSSGDSSCGCGHENTEKKCDCHSDFSEAETDFPMPKPNLVTMATTIAQQAMIAMGVLPNPVTHKSTFMLNQASYFIDTVELVFEKTEGNRTKEETDVIEKIIHELRMLFVAATSEKNRRDTEQKK